MLGWMPLASVEEACPVPVESCVALTGARDATNNCLFRENRNPAPKHTPPSKTIPAEIFQKLLSRLGAQYTSGSSGSSAANSGNAVTFDVAELASTPAGNFAGKGRVSGNGSRAGSRNVSKLGSGGGVRSVAPLTNDGAPGFVKNGEGAAAFSLEKSSSGLMRLDAAAATGGAIFSGAAFGTVAGWPVRG